MRMIIITSPLGLCISTLAVFVAGAATAVALGKVDLERVKANIEVVTPEKKNGTPRRAPEVRPA